jgi:hypothetical protein
MNNEPVAWIDKNDIGKAGAVVVACQESKDDIPLYTHPAKTLTDEEIGELAEMMADMYNLAMLKLKGSRGYSEQCSVMEEILRAILRKANEK